MRYDTAEFVSVVDGDSVHLRINTALDVWLIGNCRLFGINAPEPRGVTKVAGLAAKAHLIELMRDLKFEVEMAERDKYGRPLVVLVRPDGTTVNASMVEAGHAVRYFMT